MITPDMAEDLRWADACLSAALIAMAPGQCGGAVVHAQAGPVRDNWLAGLQALYGEARPMRRLPVNAAPQRILGGLDLAATLKAGHPVMQRGLLSEADGGLLVAAMAERMAPSLAAQIGGVLDTHQLIAERDGLQIRSGTRFDLVALDESLDDEPGVPGALAERLSFQVNLEGVSLADSRHWPVTHEDVAAARKRLAQVRLSDEVCEALCGASLALGVHSARAAVMAGRVARLHAALLGNTLTGKDDAEAALRLVLLPRATRMPEFEAEAEDQPPEAEQPPPPEQDETPPDAADGNEDQQQPDLSQLADILVEAARALLPADLMAKAAAAKAARQRAGEAGRAGAMQKASTRGRPTGTRKGELQPGVRLNVVETLRAAAPWQPLRRRQREQAGGEASANRIEVRKQDIRINRFQQHGETTAIFVVDASGSSALNRLAEAKGAVELLLADCYVRRDQVALIAFRGQAAELVLPPTRSLVRAKRCLTGLSGGGGTPLANALEAAALLADGERRRGRTPVLVVLTDGQANVARDGGHGRAQARADAHEAARRIRLAGLTGLLLDISPRSSAAAAELAKAMGAQHVPLPRADAARVSELVRTATGAPAPARAS